jgi:tellurite methyltransferase
MAAGEHGAVRRGEVTLTLEEQFGPIDIYLFDQLLRGHIVPGMRILDAGCGPGRNLIYLLREGYDVSAVDAEPRTLPSVQKLFAELAPGLPISQIHAEPLEKMSFADRSFDVVICSAVLHFCRDDAQFDAMLNEMWRVLKPGGLFFSRLASSIGMESRMRPLGNRRFRLPDESERYLVDELRLLEVTKRLGATLVDPLKTTVVQDQRCMTTWVMRKARG